MTDSPLTGTNKRSVFATSLVLAGANLLPLIAIWKADWKIYDLLMLYWMEFIFIGCSNVLRIALINPRGASLASHLLKFIFIPFFIAHFGFFIIGLGLVIQILFKKENFEVADQMVALLVGNDAKVFWPLVIAHLFSFFWNYIGQREFRRTTVTGRMAAPYLRVLPLALLVIGGAYLLVRWNLTDPVGLSVLVLAKTLLDLILHPLIHLRLMKKPEQTG